MEKKYRRALLIGLGTTTLMGTLITPAIMLKENIKNFDRATNIKESGTVDSLNIYNERHPYELNIKGFILMINDAKKIYPELSDTPINDSQVEKWFLDNEQKAIEKLSYVNAKIYQRGIGDFFSGMFKTIVGGVATAITLGKVKETIDFTNEGVNLLQRDPNGPDASESENGKVVGECLAKVGSNFIKIPGAGEVINGITTLVGLATTKC